LPKTLPQQGSGAGFACSPRSIGSTENFVASPRTPDRSPMAASLHVACGKVSFQSMEASCANRCAAAYPNGTGVFLGGIYSEKDIISYGGIPEKSHLGVRSNNRIRA
jgi:hypothetical protein